MSSTHFLAGWDAYRRMDPDPPGDAHREFRRGYQQAKLVGQEGPMGTFDVFRCTTPFGEAVAQRLIGQVVASSQPEAIMVARLVYPQWAGDRLVSRRG